MQLIIDSETLRNIFNKVGDCPDHVGLRIPEPTACAEGGKCGECWEKALIEAGFIKAANKSRPKRKIPGFAGQLAELREQAGLTQKELAKKLKVSRSALSLWETGKREPEHEMLIRIADFFEVSVDHLLGRHDSSNSTTEANLRAASF